MFPLVFILVDIQRQLRHKSATITNHYLTDLVNESKTADVFEEMQNQKQESIIAPMRQKKTWQSSEANNRKESYQ